MNETAVAYLVVRGRDRTGHTGFDPKDLTAVARIEPSYAIKKGRRRPGAAFGAHFSVWSIRTEPVKDLSRYMFADEAVSKLLRKLNSKEETIRHFAEQHRADVEILAVSYITDANLHPLSGYCSAGVHFSPSVVKAAASMGASLTLAQLIEGQYYPNHEYIEEATELEREGVEETLGLISHRLSNSHALPLMEGCHEAHFHFRGRDFDPTEISKELSISPSRATKKGEPRPSTGVWRRSSWALNSDLDPTLAPELHLESLMQKVQNKSIAIRRLARRLRAQPYFDYVAQPFCLEALQERGIIFQQTIHISLRKSGHRLVLMRTSTQRLMNRAFLYNNAALLDKSGISFMMSSCRN